MGIKEYAYNGGTYQFTDDDVPSGATPVSEKSKTPANKAAKPAANKQVKPEANKAAKPAAPAPSGVDDASDPGASE